MNVIQSVPIVFAATAAVATAAPFGNLVENGSFDTVLAPWTVVVPSGSSPSWVDEDCCGNSASGSMRLLAIAFPMTVHSNCMAVLPGHSYDLVVMARAETIAGYQPSAAGTSVLWHEGASCDEELISSDQLLVAVDSGWQRLGATFTAPGNANSVTVVISADYGGLGGGVDAYFDDAGFGPLGSVPVDLQSFDVD